MSGLARIALFMTTGALAVALGGCGAGDGAAKNEYVRAVNIAQAQFAGAARRVKLEITQTSSVEQDQRALTHFGSTIDRLVAMLRAIREPADVRGAHARLVAVMAGHRDEVSSIIAKLRSPTSAVLDDVNRELGAATLMVNARLRTAIDAINGKLRGS